MGDIVITYEVLFEFLRKEKNNPELQLLEERFYEEVIRYLKEKRSLIEEQQHEDPLANTELQNIKRIIKELWERRERKLVMMALNKARTSAYVVNTKNMLPPEQAFFEALVNLLSEARENILYRLLQEQMPTFHGKEDTQQGDALLVRFLEEVKQFVGPELEVYGPFHKDEIAQLPQAIAQLLIEKGVAEEIKEH